MASREGVSHGRVIVDCELSLRQYLNLDKVVPAMVDMKLMNKKVGKALMKKNDMGLFIDLLKQLPLEQFGVFLTVVRSIEEDSETKERPLMKILSSSLKNMKLKDGSSVQKVFSEFTKAADTQISSRLPSSTSISSTTNLDESLVQSTTVQSSLSEATTNANAMVNGSESLVTEQPSDADSEQAAAALERRLPFPSGFMSGCRSRSFTREGGMFYSPEHGVTVIIPNAAAPSSVDKFMLGVYIYMKGPFSLPENAQLCSPIVWFHLQPKFTCEAPVTVKIPHSAIIAMQPRCCGPSMLLTGVEDDSLSVVTVEEGTDEGAMQYALTRRLNADFSDGYHAIFTVKHFSPHGVVKCRQQQSPVRNRLGSNESSGIKKRTHSNSSTVKHLPCNAQMTTKDLHKSGSLEDEKDELYKVTQGERRKESEVNAQGGMNFCIARCMPIDRSTGDWTVDFLISHWHPTGIQVIHHYAKQLHGESVDFVRRKFYFTEDDIEFVPESWTSRQESWKVAATENNVLSMDDVIMELPSLSARGDQVKSELAFYPPRLTYAVQALTSSPTEQLDCTIQVRGAETNKGKQLFFKLQSKNPLCSSYLRKGPASRSLQQLHIVPYLYSRTTSTDPHDILQAISQHDRSFPLNLDNTDHIKFLIDISLQLTGQNHPQRLGQALHLERYQVQRIQDESQTDISWQVYSILIEWLATNAGRYTETTTLGALKDALSKIEVEDIKISELRDASDRGISLISTNLDTIPIGHVSVSRENFLLNMSEKLQCCWRQVGSLMGLPKNILDTQASQNDQLHEQAYQMLLTWQKKTKFEATTHGVLFKAVQRLHDHHPSIVNDAWLYCAHYLEWNNNFKLESTPVTTL